MSLSRFVQDFILCLSKHFLTNTHPLTLWWIHQGDLGFSILPNGTPTCGLEEIKSLTLWLVGNPLYLLNHRKRESCMWVLFCKAWNTEILVLCTDPELTCLRCSEGVNKISGSFLGPISNVAITHANQSELVMFVKKHSLLRSIIYQIITLNLKPLMRSILHQSWRAQLSDLNSGLAVKNK